MSIKIDLSQFKHVSSDAKSTKLRHRDGHFLVLSHKALNPDNQKALSALSNGKEYQTSNQAQESQDQKLKMADGGKVKIPPQQDPSPKVDPKDRDKEMMNNAGSGANSISDAMNKLAHPWADGGEVEEDSSFMQAVKELPSDIQHAFSPEGLSDSTSAIYNSAKDGLTGNLPEQLQQKAKGGKIQRYAEGTPNAPVRDISALSDEEIANQPALGENEQVIDKQAPQQVQAASPQQVQAASKQEEHNPDLLSHMSYAVGKWGSDAVKGVIAKKLAPLSAAYNLASKIGSSAVAGAAGEPEPKPEASQPQMQPQQTQQSPPTQPAPPSPQVVNETQEAAPSPSLSSDISMTNNPMGMAQQGFANQVQAERDKAQAVSGLAENESKVLQSDADAKTKAYDRFQQSYAALNQERLAHIEDIKNGHIDPNAYWKDHSKIASAIGMIIAGFNPTTKPNAAIDFLKFQMDRNIDAQKANLSSANNLLNANLQQFHNIDAATAMTRLMQNDVITSQLQQAATKAKTPLAQAAAQQAIGALQMSSAQQFRQLAMTQAMMGLAGKGDPQSEAEFKSMTSMMRMMGMGDVAKDMEAKRIPGIGTASREVPSEVLKEISAHKTVNDLMNISLQFSQQHRGMLDKLSPPEIAKAHTIQNQLIGAIKQAQHDGVYKPSEAEFLTNQIGGSPAAFLSSISSEPKIRQLQQIKQHEYQQLLAPYGIKTQPLQVTPEQYGEIRYDKAGNAWKLGPNGKPVRAN